MNEKGNTTDKSEMVKRKSQNFMTLKKLTKI